MHQLITEGADTTQLNYQKPYESTTTDNWVIHAVELLLLVLEHVIFQIAKVPASKIMQIFEMTCKV